MELKKRLLAARMRLGYSTQSEMARKIGVDPAVVSYWENGKREPTFDQVGKLLSIGVTVEELYEIDYARAGQPEMYVAEERAPYVTEPVESASMVDVIKRLEALEQRLERSERRPVKAG